MQVLLRTRVGSKFSGELRSWREEVVRREDQFVDFWEGEGAGEDLDGVEVDGRLSRPSPGVWVVLVCILFLLSWSS